MKYIRTKDGKIYEVVKETIYGNYFVKVKFYGEQDDTTVVLKDGVIAQADTIEELVEFVAVKFEWEDLPSVHSLNELYKKAEEKGCDIYTDTMFESTLLDKSCLELDTMCYYLKHEEWQEKEIVIGYAWHIDNLVVFDKPKEIKDFCKVGCLEKAKQYIETCPLKNLLQKDMPDDFKQFVITKAPQSWCYVEV